MADDDTMKFGLLMESAQAHQRMAEVHLEKLRAHTQDLDDVVRDEIRRTLIDELKSLTAESERAAQALRGMKRAASLRGLVWHIAMVILCTAIPGAMVHWLLPSASEIADLRAQRDALTQNIGLLAKRGARSEWRACGADRLCIRVDREAPVYGEKSDYYVVKGY